MRGALHEKAVTLLRWSEKYTKTDMVYLASGGSWLALGYAMQVVSGLVLTVAFANLLPKESYGIYQFIISVAAVIGGFTLTGMGTALMRAVARGSGGTLASAFRIQLTWSIGIVLAAAAVAAYYFVNGNTMLGSAFLIVGATLPLLSGFSLYRPFLEGRRLFRESTVLGLWRRPIPVITLLATLFVTDNPVLLVLAYFLSHTLSMGLLYLSVLHRYKESAPTDPELVSYSKHLSAMNLVGLITNNVDKMLVFHFLGAASVAVYTLAQLPSAQLTKMFGLVGSLIFPKFALREFNTLQHTIFHKVLVFFATTVAVVAVYIIVAPYLFKLFFPSYSEAVLLSQILILIVLTKPFTLYAQAFAAHGLKRVQHFVQISVALIKLTLLVILLPLFGLWGAVWSTLLMSVYWAIVVAILFYTRK